MSRKRNIFDQLARQDLIGHSISVNYIYCFFFKPKTQIMIRKNPSRSYCKICPVSLLIKLFVRLPHNLMHH